MNSTVILPNGRDAPSLGLGTWHMGERIGDPAAEALALKRGLDLGATLIAVSYTHLTLPTICSV